jgi:hypothetical protein
MSKPILNISNIGSFVAQASDQYSVPFKHVLALAFAAQRVNGGYKKDNYKPDVKWSNKQLVSYTLTHEWEAQTPEARVHSIVPKNFEPLVIIDEDYRSVEEAEQYFAKFSMLVLNDNESEFNRKIYQLCLSDYIRASESGIVSYIPEFLNRYDVEKPYLKKLKSQYKNSKHITSDTVDVEVEILRKLFLKDYEKNLYICGDGANLISFINKNSYDVGDKIRLKAKVVSRMDYEFKTKLPLTAVNYAKVSKKV